MISMLTSTVVGAPRFELPEEDRQIKIKTCPVCGFIEDDDTSFNLSDKACDGCINEALTLENALEYGKTDEDNSVTIKGFLAYAFDKAKIEEILKREWTEYATLMPGLAQAEIERYTIGRDGDVAAFVDEIF